ncbi:MAG TPA: substrate-binding domain-containing protein [Jatrophihabitantaceae bacterium]|nr:substrate-binding domain-containing protein [Jatrophihabitantaceae bacterium]
MLRSNKVKAGAVGIAAAALTVGMAVPAHADQHPRAKDAVGVGSDTVQYVSDFVDDGTPAGDSGYNTANTARRVWSFDATADASGRALYGRSSTTAIPGTIVLRAGTNPINRPNGSGSGITAFLADSNHRIDFVRSSRLPSPTEQTTAGGTAGFGAGIHVYRIATDGLDIAVSQTVASNAPAALTATDLINIYKGTYLTWSQVPGYAGPAPSATIIPVLPQTGSGTRNDFLADLKANNGGVDVPLTNPNLVTSEEHDPTAISASTSPANTIAPFSTGRDNLIDTGYFGSTPSPNTIRLLNGAGTYHLNRNLYILVRDADVTSATPFQVGGTQNLVNTLFGTSTSWYAKASNSALFTGAGVTQSWADLGLAHS